MIEKFRISFHGDCSLVINFSENIEIETNRILYKILDSFESDLKSSEFIEDIYPTFNSIIIDYNNLLIDFEKLKVFVEKTLLESMYNFQLNSDSEEVIEIPVNYGGVYGPDLSMMSDKLKISEKQIVKIHTSRTYRIYMIGFMPGFPYLGGLDEKISFPRLSTPRISVPAGSVGIAGIQTGVYPFESPGGWNIIGKTETKLFDTEANPPALLKGGVNLRFLEI